MKKIEFPARLEDLLKRFEKMPVHKVRCHRCGKDWERLGKPPADFDGICPTCYDKGVRVGVRNARSEPHDPPLPRNEFLSKAGFPRELQITPFRDRKAEGSDWRGEPWSLGYTGPTKTGKSMLLAEIAWRNRERLRSPFYVRGDRLVSALYGRFGKEEEGQYYRRAVECSLLIVDDLGWGTRGNAMDPVFEVLADRHGNAKPTLWAANAPIEALADVNAPLFRRLLQGFVVKMKSSQPCP